MLNEPILETASQLKTDLNKNGYSTKPFPDELRAEMLTHIEAHILEVAQPFSSGSVKQAAMSVPDQIWSEKMTRAFRIFPKKISDKIQAWAHGSIAKELGKEESAVNVVYPQETETNPKLTESDIAIYWRCVRPGKPDAGRPHRDASFWVLEFEEGYDPKIPFNFNYLTDCIKIWIPLKGCTPTTTLQIVPGSHRMEIPTTVDQTEYGRRPTISKAWLDQNEPLFMSPIELSHGSCIIFDMDLVHRGPTHNNHDLRISAELCFIVRS